MKYTKNRISRRSRVKHSGKTKYSSSKRKNIKTKNQKGGNLHELFKKNLQKFLDSRFFEPPGKIKLNKFDLQIICLYIWATGLYDNPYILVLNYKTLVRDIIYILNEYIKISNVTQIMVMSSREQGYFYAPNLVDWIYTNKLEDLIPTNKKRDLKSLLSNEKYFNKDLTLKNPGELTELELNELRKAFIEILKPSLLSRNNNKEYNDYAKTFMVNTQATDRENDERDGGISRSHPSTSDATASFAEDSKELTHMWFKHWPDHGVPQDKTEFIKFIKLVYKDILEKGGTTLIHCSAGVGRTGVVYLVLRLMFQYNLKLDGKPQTNITIDQIIHELKLARTDRMYMVQTCDQFNFILDVFGLKTRMTPDEFKGISRYGYRTESTCSVALLCQTKNRYLDILPYDDKSVILRNRSVDNPCNAYINASKMGDFSEDRNVYTAQGPKENTKEDFINMLFHYNVKRIVMVTGLKESGKDKCFDYTDGLALTSLPKDEAISYYKVTENLLTKIENPPPTGK